jgi:NAD+ diphosphatase
MDEAQRRFWLGMQPPDESAHSTAWLAFRGDQLLVRLGDEVVALPEWADLEPFGAVHDERHYLGRLGGIDYYALELPAEAEPPGGMHLEGLRSLFGQLADDHMAVAGRASQILEWDRTHQFCGRCGEKTVRATTERAKKCPRCGQLSFPRLSPAVIMRVERDDRILLGRSPHFPERMYSVLAGFVEPGESIEETVVREVEEEVGIQVKDLRYFGSQSWPFPHSLMLGFTARHAGGEIRVNHDELEDAGWFSRDDLPQLPSKMSIAPRLIDAWLERPDAVGRA